MTEAYNHVIRVTLTIALNNAGMDYITIFYQVNNHFFIFSPKEKERKVKARVKEREKPKKNLLLSMACRQRKCPKNK